ncbi:hypothetical protein EZV77_07920 [Burkholderia thailandensis]|uniref:Uncharacterized protein n=1 Tax=Burkholderia thailandensis TaxID=57975 RepID=A0AAW9CUS0_BURTH|nr:hypothetical protein AQ475_11680 [Burkholderia thailandensis]AOJ56307.1 hypothetical protein AQ477_07085 [Burkholderia thailandensis]AVR23737.1 hypothetical protein A8H32_00050 [Burkholderia thailandensis]KXF62050.1 hypothetical protein AQ476_12630 [Burkholderia thailandensis]MDD1481106.1 hypothetical protein [Burkholderia thailandensis]
MATFYHGARARARAESEKFAPWRARAGRPGAARRTPRAARDMHRNREQVRPPRANRLSDRPDGR